MEDLEICKECGGNCCKRVPGLISPTEIAEPFVDTLEKMFRSGKWAVDWWNGDPRIDEDEISQGFFIRPAVKGKEYVLSDPTWGGECTFLTNRGCLLSHDERPGQCQAVIPSKGEKCITPNEFPTKRQICVEWVPYYEAIKEAIRRINPDWDLL